MKTINREELYRLVRTELFNCIISNFSFKEIDSILYKYYKNYYLIHNSFGLSENSGYFYKVEGIGIRINLVEDIWSDLKIGIGINDSLNRSSIDISLGHSFPQIINQSYYDNIFQGIKCPATKDGIKSYVQIIKDLFNQYLLISANYYTDIKNIDKEVNSQLQLTQNNVGFLGTEGAAIRRIIIAKLADNPALEEIVKFHNKSFKDNYHLIEADRKTYWDNYINTFNHVYERLEKIKPLDNSVLD